MTEIKLTDDEAKAGINGFKLKDGTFFVLRKIKVDDNITSIEGLHIWKSGRGVSETILLTKRVSSFSEAVKELRNEGY